MKFLFYSNDLIAGNLAYKLHQEGHEVRLYIKEKERRKNLENLVPKTQNWKSELNWVGKSDGVIIFDDIIDDELQDTLRHEGYFVFGAGTKGCRLEKDRSYAQKILEQHNFLTFKNYDFVSIERAVDFIRKNPNKWVIKKNDTSSNSISYVGNQSDGQDVIDVLLNYQKNNVKHCRKITLQQKVEGVEIAIARYFNGKTWTSPIEINIEHNPLMAGDIGMSTSEMGTIAWYSKNDSEILFANTLKKIEKFLQKIDYRGVIDLNCIVNKTGIYPLEFTTRFGSPIVHLQSEMLKSGWGNLIYATANGNQYMSEWRDGYGIVVFITTPPFPYLKKIKEFNPQGQKIYISNSKVLNHLHFEDVSYDKVNKNYFISDTRGYTLYVTASAKNMIAAQEKVYTSIENIYFPKMMYRNDIGTNFIQRDMNRLQEWGYIG